MVNRGGFVIGRQSHGRPWKVMEGSEDDRSVGKPWWFRH